MRAKIIFLYVFGGILSLQGRDNPRNQYAFVQNNFLQLLCIYKQVASQ